MLWAKYPQMISFKFTRKGQQIGSLLILCGESESSTIKNQDKRTNESIRYLLYEIQFDRIWN